MKIYSGGTAIMLRCNPTGPVLGQLGAAALAWQFNEKKKLHTETHITVQFVGRDVSRERVQHVINACFEIARMTVEVQFTGNFLVLGHKARHLVAEVSHYSTGLLDLRSRLKAHLGATLDPDTFNYTPHMTLCEIGPGPKLLPPEPIQPFSEVCTELEVKYGKNRMVVELC